MDKTTARVVTLFDELIHRGEEIKQSCTRQYFSGQKRQFPPEVFGEWRTNCLSLLKSTFGSSSPQFDGFVNAKLFDYYNATQIYLGILRGARTDLEKGYFFHKDLMLSVSIFDSFLARARVLIGHNELERAAGLLDAVLQEILVKVCEHKKIPHEDAQSVEALCERLEKAEVLPKDIQERIREVGVLGKPGQGAPDAGAVKNAVEWIASFLDNYLGARILILN
jgi:hypothetical protein